MNPTMQYLHADLARRGPQLFNFLETTLWLDVDGVDLLELQHRKPSGRTC
jgi:hypothetical protein